MTLQLRIDDLLEELSKKEAEWCSKEEKLILEVQSTTETLLLETCLILTPHYYEQFALPLARERNPYIFCKSNPLNTDTFYGPLSVCVNWVLIVQNKYVILNREGCEPWRIEGKGSVLGDNRGQGGRWKF